MVVEQAQGRVALGTVDQGREARRHRRTPHGIAEVAHQGGDALSWRLVTGRERGRLLVQRVDGIGHQRGPIGPEPVDRAAGDPGARGDTVDREGAEPPLRELGQRRIQHGAAGAGDPRIDADGTGRH